MYSCHLFLISPGTLRILLFLPFIVPILTWNIPLISLFLKRSLVFPILLLSFLSLHCFFFFFFKKVFFSFLAISGTLHSVFPPLPCLLLFFFPQLFVKLPHTSLCLLAFLFLRDGLVTISCILLQTSIHSSLGTLSTRSNPLHLFIIPTVWS